RGPNAGTFAGYEVVGFSFRPPPYSLQHAQLRAVATAAPACVAVEQLCIGWPMKGGGCGIYPGERTTDGASSTWNIPPIQDAYMSGANTTCYEDTDQIVRKSGVMQRLLGQCKNTTRGAVAGGTGGAVGKLTLAVLNGTAALTSKVEVWSYDTNG